MRQVVGDARPRPHYPRRRQPVCVARRDGFYLMSSYQIDRDEQIEAIVTAARRPCLPILPSLSAPGYSYLSPEGTRVGTIKATADEKRQEWERAEDVKAAEFRGYLTTASDSELARKVDYWLRGGKEQE